MSRFWPQANVSYGRRAAGLADLANSPVEGRIRREGVLGQARGARRTGSCSALTLRNEGPGVIGLFG
jgi:hypothetical protein